VQNDEKPALARLYGASGVPPITTTLGATFVSLREDTLEAEYVGAPAFLNPAGQVQGGMLCAMLDDVTATLVTSTLADGEHCATLNMNTSFLRPAQPGALSARATLVRRGRGVCNVNGELWQDGRLLATATAVCMIVAR
jgi:uncharacterized protein (TIGR00369 family)